MVLATAAVGKSREVGFDGIMSVCIAAGMREPAKTK